MSEAGEYQELSLTNLDDGVLLRIFGHLSPLPDLFSVARACTRFKRIVEDRRLSIMVTQGRWDDEVDSSEGPQEYTSFGEAVRQSRPGETIFVAPGFHEAEQVEIHWPLSIVGLGYSPTGEMSWRTANSRAVKILRSQFPPAGEGSNLATLSCSKRGEPPVLVSANCRLEGLEMRSQLAPCVDQVRGRLEVHDCLFRCAEHPLDFLAGPIARGDDAGPVIASAARLQGGGSDKGFVQGLSTLRCMYTRAGAVLWFRADKAPRGSLVRKRKADGEGVSDHREGNFVEDSGGNAKRKKARSLAKQQVQW